MPADILSEKPPAVIEPAAEVSPAKPAADRNQTQWFDHLYQSVHGTALPEREKVEEAYKQEEAGARRLIEPAAARVRSAAEAPSPPLPRALPQPPVPDIKPRSFLQVEGKQSLPALINATMHLATTIMGARNAPQAGLFALTGAMQGWSAGDAISASRKWKEYLGYVDKVKEENDQAWRLWEAAMKDNASNLTRATAAFAVSTSEAGLGHYATAAAERSMGYVEKDLETVRHISTTLQTNALRMTIAQTQQMLAEQRAAETRRHNLQTEAARAQSLRLAGENSKVVRDNEALATSSQNILDDASQVRQALDLLKSEGLLNTGPTMWDKARLNVAIQGKPNRQDIADAFNTVRRIGGPLLVKREVTSGMSAGLLRLKSIADQEVGDLNALPEMFWDRVLKTANQRATQGREQARRHLEALGRSMPPVIEGGEWTAEPVD